MSHDNAQLGEVVTDLVEVHHVLTFGRKARAGDACVGDDRNVEVDAGLVNRVVAAIAHRDLRDATGRKGRDGLDPVIGVRLADATNRRRDLVGIDFETEEHATRVALLRFDRCW